MTARSLVVDRSDLADTAQPDQLAELLIAQLGPQLPELLPLPIVDVASDNHPIAVRSGLFFHNHRRALSF